MKCNPNWFAVLEHRHGPHLHPTSPFPSGERSSAYLECEEASSCLSLCILTSERKIEIWGVGVKNFPISLTVNNYNSSCSYFPTWFQGQLIVNSEAITVNQIVDVPYGVVSRYLCIRLLLSLSLSLLTLELTHRAAAFLLTIRHSWKMFASTLDNFQFILAGNEDLLPHLGYLLLGLFTNKHDKCFSLWSVLI